MAVIANGSRKLFRDESIDFGCQIYDINFHQSFLTENRGID